MGSESQFNISDTSLGTRSRRNVILSVDDEPGVLHARYRLLSSVGYEVVNASDGAQALEIFGNHAVDLVLLDYAMPGIDGGLVAEAMKQHRPNVPVILISGAQVPDKAVSVVNRYLPKGDGPESLLQAVQELLSCSEEPKPPSPDTDT